MHRATLFSRTPLRQLLLRTAAVVLLSAAATAHATNDGLSITGPTQWMRVIAGRPCTFTPKVADPSGRALTFRILNKPSWVAFNASTGQLSGTPPNIIKTYYNISISVSDGVSTAKTPYFYIRVVPPDTYDKPSISGTPTTSVTVGSPYAFRPSASDPFYEPLSFSVKNKPAWASFSIATGRLYGTPTKAQAGTYGNIVISATNGHYAAALPAFSITVKTGVTSTSTGSAKLNWLAPTKTTSGTSLSNLAGVRIYYGTSASNLSHMVQVPIPETSYIINNLAAGVWYFAAAAYTTTGYQSARSSVVSTTIP
jgi:putative Ig domain-containing protein